MSATEVNWATLWTGAVNLRDSLSAFLEEMIVSSGVPEGTRLPPERKFAAELGVSRASLRDALRRLELKGSSTGVWPARGSS